jgi:chromosome segregation ATPase
MTTPQPASPDVREALARLEYWAACEVPATAADDAATIRARIDALTADLADYRTAANAEAAEVDRRGQRIATLTAEVERLRTDSLAWRSERLQVLAERNEQRERAEAAEAQLAAMTERAGKDAEDARRYRWLRGQDIEVSDLGYGSVPIEMEWSEAAQLDADIDAAIDAIAREPQA